MLLKLSEDIIKWWPQFGIQHPTPSDQVLRHQHPACPRRVVNAIRDLLETKGKMWLKFWIAPSSWWSWRSCVMILPRQADHDLLHYIKRNESKTYCQLHWRLMNPPCSVLSRPEASPLLRDVRGDLLTKGNHPNVPGQAHVKFDDGDEHEIPFPCNAKEVQVKFLWVPFS
jgi:hypothetical protein